MLELVGNTPILKLNKVGKGLKANVFVKLEYLNPSGSYKDRMALSMIEAAEKGLTWNGKMLKPGSIVCDASAGNTAPALAFVCAVKGYKVRLCSYRTVLRGGKDQSTRLKITNAFGAEVYECPCPSEAFLKECSDENERTYSYVMSGKMHMYEMEKENDNVVWVDQIYNRYNWIGQMQMGREIHEQLDGKIDAWGCSVGSGATLLGVTLGLKECGVKPFTFGVGPEGEPVSDFSAEMAKNRKDFDEYGMKARLAKRMGLNKWLTEKSIVQTMFDLGYPDEFFTVNEKDARDTANRLCKEEGIYCGMSSGANVFAALKVGERMNKDDNIVTVIVDRRDRYLAEYPNDVYVV
jgi:cystathionine beta-synthase